MMKAAYLFPGQGSQRVAMGRDLRDGYPAAAEVFRNADDALGFALSELCFEGPEEELRKTVNAQPALVIVSYAALRALKESGGEVVPPPTFVAGHSLGEYTALLAADVLAFADCVRLARERGRLMYEAGLERPGGMAAIIGMGEDKLAEVCRQTDTCIANLNCPGQLVISGLKDNVSRAGELACENGAKRAIPLRVSGAFHSPLMASAAEGLKRFVADLRFNKPSVPIVANTTARPLTTAAEVKEELLNQLCQGIQWQRSMEYMVSQGVDTFVEIGPGEVLTGLMKRIDRNVTTVNIGDAKAVANLASLFPSD